LKLGWTTDQIEVAFQAITWLGFMGSAPGRYEPPGNAEALLRGLGFYFNEVVLSDRGQRFNTNCALDSFAMTYPPARERMLQRAFSETSSGPAEGISEKMIDALRRANTSCARGLQDSSFHGRNAQS
jgi:hypothetical protein